MHHRCQVLFLVSRPVCQPADRSVVQVEKVCNLSLTISVTMHRLDNPRVLAEDLQGGFAVPIFLEDVFSRIAAQGHMVQRTVEIYSERTSHDLAQGLANSKIQDPFTTSAHVPGCSRSGAVKVMIFLAEAALSQKHADIFGIQHGLIQHDGAPGDLEAAVDAPEDILPRADEDILVGFHPRAINKEIGMDF